jgi:AAA15 family ATPase/GTPase
MLIEFTVKNYKSIKDTLTLSMLPSKRIKSKDRLNNLISVPNYPNLYLLKSAILYGANNSGKSNILESLFIFKQLVNDTLDLDNLDKYINSISFDFDNQNNHKIELTIDFIAENGLRYNYNILFNTHCILKETLSYYPSNRKIQKFKLIYNRIEEFGEVLVKGLNKKYYQNLESNKLLLSKTNTNNISFLISIYNFFNSITKSEFKNEIKNNILDEPCINYITNMMRIIDPNIKSLEINNDNLSLFYNRITLFYRQFSGKKELNIPYKIRLNSMTNGSIKLFILSYLIYKSINSNQFLIIDDIDKELHSDLTSYLIEELHNTQNNSQFLLSSHDVTQMNNFDKDQVYIIEKDYYGVTTCSSVSEFTGLHKKMTLENWYRQGRLGGIPHIENT